MCWVIARDLWLLAQRRPLSCFNGTHDLICSNHKSQQVLSVFGKQIVHSWGSATHHPIFILFYFNYCFNKIFWNVKTTHHAQLSRILHSCAGFIFRTSARKSFLWENEEQISRTKWFCFPHLLLLTGHCKNKMRMHSDLLICFICIVECAIMLQSCQSDFYSVCIKQCWEAGDWSCEVSAAELD